MKTIFIIWLAILFIGSVANNLQASAITSVTTYASTNGGYGPGPYDKSNTSYSENIVSEFYNGGEAYAQANLNGTLLNQISGSQNANYLSQQYTYSTYKTDITNNYELPKNIHYDFSVNAFLSVNGMLYDNRSTLGESEYNVTINLNNENIWSSSVLLKNSWQVNEYWQPGSPLEVNTTKPVVSGNDLGGNYVSGFDLSRNFRGDYTVNDYLGSLFLGTLLPGDSFTLQTTVSLKGAGDEVMGYYDKGSVSLSGKVTASPVPVPSTMVLLGSGLVGLAAVGRRKRN